MLRATITSIAIAAFTLILARATIADEVKCDGAIIAIDGDTVTVKDMTKEHQMKIEPATKITSAGKPVMVSDLKVGHKVKCVCERKDNMMICTSMEIMRDTP
jgi:endonuclease YncB( thermonuclease family)